MLQVIKLLLAESYLEQKDVELMQLETIRMLKEWLQMQTENNHMQKDIRQMQTAVVPTLRDKAVQLMEPYRTAAEINLLQTDVHRLRMAILQKQLSQHSLL